MTTIRHAALAALLALCAAAAWAQNPDTIRKNLTQRLPLLGPIDEVTKTPMPGLFEVRVGTDLFYTDAQGDFLIQGNLIDAKAKKNLTDERMDKLLVVPFDELPLADAFTIVRGNGKRKLVVFEDPNCPYCKSFEKDLQKVNDVTIYMFLMPILGQDSADKSRNLWCAKDRAGAWLDWMLRNRAAPSASCDTTAITRNMEFGKKRKITGTPTLFLADGSRIPGALPAAEVEKLLAKQ